MSASKLILRSVSFARSSLPKVSSGARTRGALGTETLHKIQRRKFRASIKFKSAPISPFGRVIASILQAGELLRRSVEPTRTPRAPLLRIFSARRGQLRLLISNSIGALKALRSLSFYPRVKFCQEPSRGVFHTFSFSPVLSPVPGLHVSNRHQKDGRDHGKSTRKYG